MNYRKGRGAQINTHNHFLKHEHEIRDDFLNYCALENEKSEVNKTQYLQIYPKTILNKVNSPDIGVAYSMNPYQGCEHGCIYCYARNTHEYWGYSAGLDFERKILYKANAADLLEKKIRSKNWRPQNIMFSGNTDCYQPIEKKIEITRKMLAVLLKLKHPVSIITKNALILRDLDILTKMAALNLVNVSISITTLSEQTRSILEPRTTTIKKRLETVEVLTQNAIPVTVMVAPIIPAINSHEIISIVKKVSELGATSVAYTIVRLNGAIGKIFTDWVQKTYPNRADKILHQIQDCHNGNLNDSRYQKRMSGQGKIAEQIKLQFELAKNRYLKNKEKLVLDFSRFDKDQKNQISLF
ncbi:PA0069 family radical SAM protein [Tenacibaculum sp. UWU-22]|uniref:PA0069 family radical SAM protein n=1 Tax=Tenacibaculum sp. UWU-22 TaxID=3234187 RepID=UPI0034DB7100